MFGKLKRYFQKDLQNKANAPHNPAFYFPLSADALLNTPARKLICQQLWDNVSLSKSLYQQLYLQPLQFLLSCVQHLPATPKGKWSAEGGFADLTLQFTLCAVKLARGQLLPPNSSPETQSAQGALWHAVIFYSAMCYHLPLLDRIEGTFDDGSPWFPALTVPHKPFCFRFTSSRRPHYASWVTPRLLPQEALCWLGSAPAALHCLMAECAGQHSDISTMMIKAADILQTPDLAITCAKTQGETFPVDNPHHDTNGTLTANTVNTSVSTITPPRAFPLASAISAPEQDVSTRTDNVADTQVLLSLFSDDKFAKTPSTMEQGLPAACCNLGQTFFDWLSECLIAQHLDVNTVQADVHLAGGSVFLCVPAIFHHYLKVCERQETCEALQAAFEKCQCHQVIDGKRFWQGKLYESADKIGAYQRVSGYLIKGTRLYRHHPIPTDSEFLMLS